MVVVGGRLSIPANEPIPVTCDLMTKAVEILWWKPPPQQQQATGKAQMLKVSFKFQISLDAFVLAMYSVVVLTK